MSARIMAICNQKGGVGKTTTTINFGVGLTKQGKKVLLIDLDPQANLTTCLGRVPDELEVTIVDMMEQFINDTAERTVEETKGNYLIHADEIDFIPSNISLSQMENTLINVLGRERVLENVLKPYINDYDYILIDCSPSLNILTINALVVANSVLIPVQSHYLAAKGLELLLATIGKVKKQINQALIIEGILFTMYDGRTNFAKDIVKGIKENYGEDIRIFESLIPVSVKAAETTATGKSIYGYDPKGLVAQAYEKFSKEVLSNG